MKTNFSVFLSIPFILIFLTPCVQAQRIQLDDLFRLHSLNRDQVDDFATSKKLYLQEITYAKNSLYNIPYRAREGSAIRALTMTYYKTTLRATLYSTSERDEFIQLKNQIKQKGYLFTESEVYEEKYIYFTYRKPSHDKYSVLVMQFSTYTGGSLYNVKVVNNLSDF